MKPLRWVGSSREDLRGLPASARVAIAYALYLAQTGEKHPRAKPLRGFGGAGVLEVVADVEGNAYRTVYTVRFVEAVFVLHVFQKKSRRGIETPATEIELIRARLRLAQQMHERQEGREP